MCCNLCLSIVKKQKIIILKAAFNIKDFPEALFTSQYNESTTNILSAFETTKQRRCYKRHLQVQGVMMQKSVGTDLVFK